MTRKLVQLLSLPTFLLLVKSPTRTGSQSACGPRASPRLLTTIPCDMTKSSFCLLPGSAYPWSSVRRYLDENKGLVKRMYGEERHSSILRNEIDDDKEKYDSMFVYNSYQDFRPRFRSREPAYGIWDRNLFDDRYHRPVEYLRASDQLSETASTTTSTTSTPSTTTTTTAGTTDYEKSVNFTSNYDSLNKTTEGKYRNATSSSEYSEEEEEEATTIPGEEGQTGYEHYELSSSSEEYERLTTGSPDSSSEAHLSYSQEAASISTSSTEKETVVENPNPSDPERPTWGDVMEEEAKVKGVNACPVKQEVIAPYWANNTRGQTLALLNVYPFEQYVQWEKCQYENSQMMCRDGCKCEQQYRLHRLLAFDPKNDCRGIFADWFRFPSCCVCICYDLPENGNFYRISRRKSRL